MRAALFSIITVFLLFAILILSCPIRAGAKSQMIAISGQVDEHLTYLRQNQKITISTNSRSGLILLGKDFNLQTQQPIEKTLPNPSEHFYLVVNF